MRVVIDEGIRRGIRAALAHDGRAYGSHGRSLTASFTTDGLLLGDRLEPNGELRHAPAPDHIVSSLVRGVAVATLIQSLTKQRNPLFSCADTLHTLSLGVLARLAVRLLWLLFGRDVCGACRRVGAMQRVSSAISVMPCETISSASTPCNLNNMLIAE